MFDIIMSTGDLREQVDQTENEARQTPIGIINNDRDPRQQRCREKREERDCQNEEGNRHHREVGEQRDRRDKMKIPQDERQRADPGRKRNRCATAHPLKANVQQTARTTQQNPRQKWTGSTPAPQKTEERIGQQNDCADKRKGELKTDGKQFVRFPTENNERRRREAVERENFSFKKEAAEQNRTHHCRPDTRHMQAGHHRIKKDQRNDQSRRPFSRKLRNACQNPQKTRHNSDVQAGDGKEMKRARLLEWFFDVFRGLMSKTERDSADKILHVRRVVQTLTKSALHPGTRFLHRTQNRISTAMPDEHAIPRIANKHTATNVPAREIGAHTESARISGRRDRFRDSEKLQLIAELRIA